MTRDATSCVSVFNHSGSSSHMPIWENETNSQHRLTFTWTAFFPAFAKFPGCALMVIPELCKAVTTKSVASSQWFSLSIYPLRQCFLIDGERFNDHQRRLPRDINPESRDINHDAFRCLCEPLEYLRCLLPPRITAAGEISALLQPCCSTWIPSPLRYSRRLPACRTYLLTTYLARTPLLEAWYARRLFWKYCCICFSSKLIRLPTL
jgi:hypothetical protein